MAHGLMYVCMNACKFSLFVCPCAPVCLCGAGGCGCSSTHGPTCVYEHLSTCSCVLQNPFRSGFGASGPQGRKLRAGGGGEGGGGARYEP